jgi:hypothetical protein
LRYQIRKGWQKDSYILKHGIERCDLLKIDVELHEVKVLEGMSETLKKHRPSFLIEILTDEIGLGIQNLLSGLDYLYFNIDEDRGVMPTQVLAKSASYNYLVCQRQVAVSLNLI